ncbi:Asparagine synthase [Desulfomicrobium apsheronum]|uniref:asparagine synthase (glutamine-hydrolyzing) n=1 Tax=Desulfomicrobium apsheronum TaxID=52560 RepID=A0A1I3VTY9_9BACT|nr:asparagine synthase-related protein [Desulfomicrobium apsheronum]SFJ97747.1 Asparagine synthase [Desulfomicrobium apsheronum]
MLNKSTCTLNALPPLYERGFFVSNCKNQENLPDNFVPVQIYIDGIYIFRDKKTECVQDSKNDCHVVILGFVVDSQDVSSTPESIVTALLIALTRGRQVFLRALESIGGRYAIVARDYTGTFIVGDAGGIRSIFYTFPRGEVLVSSHAALLAEITGVSIVEFVDSLQSFGSGSRARNWPGRFSKFAGVFTLTPNTFLDFDAKRPHRFFTLEPPSERTVEEASDLVAYYLSTAAKNFVRNYLDHDRSKAVLFLTGGVDSRLVLSAFHGLEDHLKAFSYDINNAHAKDIELARRIAGDLGIHHVVDYGDDRATTPLVQIAAKNACNPYTGSKSVINFCGGGAFSDCAFSMRGNLGEISRGVFSARSAFLNDPPRYMARIWRRGSENIKIIFDAFTDYVSATEVEKSQWPIRIIYYWEHRHATWHAATINELDTCFDTFNIMNSRNIIEAMCSVPLDAQKTSSVHGKAIAKLNPKLLNYSLNYKGF